MEKKILLINQTAFVYLLSTLSPNHAKFHMLVFDIFMFLHNLYSYYF